MGLGLGRISYRVRIRLWLGLDARHITHTIMGLPTTTSRQGSFPAGTPGNGFPKVILTVGTVFPGIFSISSLIIRYTFCEHAAT